MRCEAMVKLASGKYTMCGADGAELHHKLLRSRGGVILDEAGETYHQIRLCRSHHHWAHMNVKAAYDGGLIIDGYVTTVAGQPYYEGRDKFLTEKYGNTVVLHSNES